MRLSVLALIPVALVAACGGPGATTAPAPPTSAPATSAPVTSAPATTAPATQAAESPGETADAQSPATTDAAGDVTVQLASSDLGEILVDAEGMTLYGFVPDQAEGAPTCYEQCADNWPPLVVEADFSVGEGLDEADFTTVERTDGSTQLQIGDYPLYYFANDSAPGDTNGQALNDVWFVVAADGTLIEE